MLLQRGDLLLRVGREAVDRDDAGLPELADVLEVLLHVGKPRVIASASGLLTSASGLPPCIFSARMVVTSTVQAGAKPPYRQLMSKNFSAPSSNAKPASVTTMSAYDRAARVQ